MIDHVNRGCVFTSHYSGQGSAEQAAEFLQAALEHEQLVDRQAGDVGMKAGTACDMSPTCQKVLGSFPDSCRPKHIFGNMEERLPEEILHAFRNLKPSKDQYRNDPEAVAEAHSAMDELLQGYFRTAFNSNAVAFCCVHERQCPLYNDWVVQSGDAGKPLTVFLAGVSCVDVSTAGLRRRKLGPQHPILRLWYEERRQCQEDLGILECTPEFDVEEANQAIGDLYEIKSIKALQVELKGDCSLSLDIPVPFDLALRPGWN